MASTAAPGYFEEVKLGKCVHQVGGGLASYPGRVGGGSSHLAWVRGQCSLVYLSKSVVE